MTVEVNMDAYESEVLAATGLTLVDFWGPKCQPCLALMPFVETLKSTYPELKVVKVDSSKNRRLCINQKVLNLPTILLYKDGIEVDRISGPDVNRITITAMIDKANI